MKCPVDGCERERRPQDLMCLDHWRQVPDGVQREVYAAYREANREGRPALRSERYRMARSMAIGAVEMREVPS